MGEAMAIRRAKETDAESIFELLAALGYPAINRDCFESIFKTLLRHPETILLIAEDDGNQIIGLITMSHRPQLRLTGTLLSIDELIVSEVARGCGVGRTLLNEAKAIARSLGAERIELHTRRTRESYRRQFYIKNGFTEVNSALLRIEKSEFNA